MKIRVSVSPTCDSSPPERDTCAQDLHRHITPDCALLASTTVVRGADEVVPVSPPPRVSVPLQQKYHITFKRLYISTIGVFTARSQQPLLAEGGGQGAEGSPSIVNATIRVLVEEILGLPEEVCC